MDETLNPSGSGPNPTPASPAAPATPRASGDGRSFLDKAWDAQHRVEQKVEGVSRGRFARVLRMARKPEPEEFRQSATIVLVGIGVIGFIGFLVYLGMSWMLRSLGA